LTFCAETLKTSMSRMHRVVAILIILMKFLLC